MERGLDANQQPVYGFLHQTFGEYLAALHLAQEMLSGTFQLTDYIHRSMWHESLLLMVGHLSLYSQTHANMLIRHILDFPAPYEETLQRNLLLVADCLADDIQINPQLRDEVLVKLAGLLKHDAPQVQDATLDRYQSLAVTRHREPAAAALQKLLDSYEDLDKIPAETRLNLAIALIHLDDIGTARPVLWPLENKKYGVINQEKVRRLRFEYWPEQAMDYLLSLSTSKDYNFFISVGTDLASSTLGPVDADLAHRVLSEAGFHNLLEALLNRAKTETERASLRWLAVLATEAPPPEVLLNLITPDTPANIRRLAATRLLDTPQRSVAITVLQVLTAQEPEEAAAAAQALVAIGEIAHLDWQLLRDTALLANNDQAPDAIATLWQVGDEAIALPAALHLLATCLPPQYENRDYRLWSVVNALVKHEQSGVGLVTARWLALRPGYRFRREASELLLEAGQVKEAIALLRFLAYECHDETSQRACQRLLILKEADAVTPLLVRVARRADPNRCYHACLALALAGHASPNGDTPIQERSELKLAIGTGMVQAYQTALH